MAPCISIYPFCPSCDCLNMCFDNLTYKPADLDLPCFQNKIYQGLLWLNFGHPGFSFNP